MQVEEDEEEEKEENINHHRKGIGQGCYPAGKLRVNTEW
jgi:hypothetical protein